MADSRTLISWLESHLKGAQLGHVRSGQGAKKLTGPDVSWATNSGQDSYGLWADANICGVVARMRWIKPGTFLMGSPDSDKEARDWEKPQHQVTLTNGFWIGQTPCTQELWQAVMGSNPSHFKGSKRPVEQVSWNDVQDFFRLVSLKNPGLDMKLPTEAQWEYACRAGSTEPRYGPLEHVAWYDDNSEAETKDVGNKVPNAWGLYDMLGSVWEWCHDWAGTYDSEHAYDPIGAAEGTDRVVRGGSWFDSAEYVRAADRHLIEPASRYALFGFRVVRGP